MGGQARVSEHVLGGRGWQVHQHALGHHIDGGSVDPEHPLQPLQAPVGAQPPRHCQPLAAGGGRERTLHQLPPPPALGLHRPHVAVQGALRHARAAIAGLAQRLQLGALGERLPNGAEPEALALRLKALPHQVDSAARLLVGHRRWAAAAAGVAHAVAPLQRVHGIVDEARWVARQRGGAALLEQPHGGADALARGVPALDGDDPPLAPPRLAHIMEGARLALRGGRAGGQRASPISILLGGQRAAQQRVRGWKRAVAGWPAGLEAPRGAAGWPAAVGTEPGSARLTHAPHLDSRHLWLLPPPRGSSQWGRGSLDEAGRSGAGARGRATQKAIGHPAAAAACASSQTAEAIIPQPLNGATCCPPSHVPLSQSYPAPPRTEQADHAWWHSAHPQRASGHSVVIIDVAVAGPGRRPPITLPCNHEGERVEIEPI